MAEGSKSVEELCIGFEGLSGLYGGKKNRKSKKTSVTSSETSSYLGDSVDKFPSSTSKWNIFCLESLGIFYNKKFHDSPQDILNMIYEETGAFRPLSEHQKCHVADIKKSINFNFPISEIADMLTDKEKVTLSNGESFFPELEKDIDECIGLVEETMIKDVRVVAVPDLTFIISSNEMLDVTDVTQIQIMTVAEVKVSTNDSLVDQKIHDTRQKPEAIDKETLQTMDPSKIRGFSQHVGQLIIGLGNSCFIKQCLGLLLHETKILITCLSTSPRYCNHIKDKLGPEDKATLHFIGPYDILKARERSQLIKAFLRLGNRQRLGISKV